MKKNPFLASYHNLITKNNEEKLKNITNEEKKIEERLENFSLV